MSSTDLTGKTSTISINFLSRCSICLLSFDDGVTKPAECACTTLDLMLTHLQTNSHGSKFSGNTGPHYIPNYKFVSRTNGGQCGKPVYSNVPPMCTSCDGNMIKLNKLHEELQVIKYKLDNHVHHVRSIMWNSPWSTIEKDFISARLDTEIIQNTLRFINLFTPDTVSDVTNEAQPTTTVPRFKPKSCQRVAFMEQNTTKDYVDSNNLIYDDNDDGDPSSKFDHALVELLVKIERDSDQETYNANEAMEESESKSLNEINFDHNPYDHSPDEKAKKTSQSIRNNEKYRISSAESKNPSERNRSRVLSKTCACDICHANVVPNELKSHLQSHIGTDPDFIHKCLNPMCNYMSISSYAVERHMNLPQKGNCRAAANLDKGVWKKTCDTCGFSSKSILVFRTHLENHETSSKPFSCPFSTCNQRFSVKQSLLIHVDRRHLHAEVDTQRCAICRQQKNASHMVAHLTQDHHVGKVFPCKLCPFAFTSRKHFISHQEKHGRLGQGMLCEICEEELTGKFENLEKLLHHYYIVHNYGQKFMCELCNKEYFILKSLKTHQVRIHGKSKTENHIHQKTKYICEQCPGQVELSNPDRLRSHQISFHGAVPFGCQYCHKTFVKRKDRNRHEKTHTGVVTQKGPTVHKCEQCDKEYQRRYQLVAHQLSVHSGEKSFVCETCGKAFGNAQNLYTHKRFTHMDESKLITCEICGKTFKVVRSLQRHMRIHTGERQFKCEICGQMFRHKEGLTVHLKRHEKLGPNFKGKGPVDRGTGKQSAKMKMLRKMMREEKKANISTDCKLVTTTS